MKQVLRIFVITIIGVLLIGCTTLETKNVTEPTPEIVYKIYDRYDGSFNPNRILTEWTIRNYALCPAGLNHLHVTYIPSVNNKEPFSGTLTVLLKPVNPNILVVIAYSYVKNGVTYVFEYNVNLKKYVQIKPKEA